MENFRCDFQPRNQFERGLVNYFLLRLSTPPCCASALFEGTVMKMVYLEISGKDINVPVPDHERAPWAELS